MSARDHMDAAVETLYGGNADRNVSILFHFLGGLRGLMSARTLTHEEIAKALDRAIEFNSLTKGTCCAMHDGPHLHGCVLPRTVDGREHFGACTKAATA